MTGPSNAKNTDWKWRTQINLGRLEAMIEVRNWLADKKKWYTSMQEAMGVAGPRHEAVMAVLDDLWVVIAANCERKGKWSSSVLMEQDKVSPKPPQPDWSGADKEKEVASLRALIEANEDDEDISSS